MTNLTLGIVVPAGDVIDRDLQPVAPLFGVYGRGRLDLLDEMDVAMG